MRLYWVAEFGGRNLMSFWGLRILGLWEEVLDFVWISFQSRLLKVSHSLGIWVASDSVAEQNRSFGCDPCASLVIDYFSAVSKAPESILKSAQIYQHIKSYQHFIRWDWVRLSLALFLTWYLVPPGTWGMILVNHPIIPFDPVDFAFQLMCPRQAGQLPPFGFHVGFMEEKLAEYCKVSHISTWFLPIFFVQPTWNFL